MSSSQRQDHEVKQGISPTIIKSGWANKEGHINKEFRKRWLELQSCGTLIYYEEVDCSLRYRGEVKFVYQIYAFKLITVQHER